MGGTRDYRLEVATRGASSVSGNVDFTAGTTDSADLQLASVPDVSPGMIRVLDGDVDPVSFRVDIIDDSATFTGHLSDSGGRLDLQNRRVRWRVSSDGGSSFSTIFTGRISSVVQQDPSLYRVSVTNERMRESEITLFTKDSLSDSSFPFDTGTTTIYPAGIRADIDLPYKFAPHTAIARWEVVDTGPVRLRAVGSDGIQLVEVDDRAVRVLEDDVKSDPKWGDPNFEYTRFRKVTVEGDKPYTGSDFELEGFGSTSSRIAGETAQPVAALKNDRKAVRQPIIQGGITGVTTGDIIRGFLYAPTRPPDRQMPLHIGNQNGSLQVDPMWVIKELYDFHGITYDSNALGTWDSSTNPTGLLDHPSIRGLVDFRLRITSTMTLREFTRQIYRQFGIVPLHVDGELSPQRIVMPATEVTDPTTAFALRSNASGSNETNVDGNMPQWRHPSDLHKTRVKARWTQEVIADRLEEEFGDQLGGAFGGRPGREPFRLESEGHGDSLDRIVTADHTEEHDHDRIDDFGVRTHEVEFVGVHDTESAKAAIDGLSREILDRYGDGAAMMEVPAIADAQNGSGTTPDDQSPGDFVRVIHEALPNPNTGDRTGEQLAQILDVTEGFGLLRMLLLYAGPASQPSNIPTLALAKDTNNPRRGVTATISNLPADATSWPLWLAVADSQPSHGSDKWYMARRPDASTASVTIGGLPSGQTIWARAQAWKDLEVRSGFTTIQSVTLDGLPAPTGLQSEVIVGDTAIFSFTAGDTDLPTEVRLDRDNELGTTAGLIRNRILPPGLTVFQPHDLAINTTYTVGVRHIDPGGLQAGVSSEDTLTFTTSATPDDPSEPDPDTDGSNEFPGNPGTPKPPIRPHTPAFPDT